MFSRYRAKSKNHKYCFGLPFFNEISVVECHTEDSMEIKPRDDEQIDSFTDYIFSNYIDVGLLSQPLHVVSSPPVFVCLY